MEVLAWSGCWHNDRNLRVDLNIFQQNYVFFPFFLFFFFCKTFGYWKKGKKNDFLKYQYLSWLFHFDQTLSAALPTMQTFFLHWFCSSFLFFVRCVYDSFFFCLDLHSILRRLCGTMVEMLRGWKTKFLCIAEAAQTVRVHVILN